MTQGFTAEQFKLFREVIAREIAARRARHADAAVNSPFSRMILRETDGIEAMAKRTFDEIEALIATAERVVVTGLEPNSIERLVEARGVNA